MRCGRPRSFDNDLDRKLYLPYLTRDGDLAVASGEELPWAQMKFERRAHYAGVSGRSEMRTIDEEGEPFYGPVRWWKGGQWEEIRRREASRLHEISGSRHVRICMNYVVTSIYRNFLHALKKEKYRTSAWVSIIKHIPVLVYAWEPQYEH